MWRQGGIAFSHLDALVAKQVGDLNDHLETDTQGKTGIDKLVQWDQIENVVDRLPEAELWMHFFKGNKSCQLPPTFSQPDYPLLSRSLAASNPSRPNIERRGQPKRADRYSGPRRPGVGITPRLPITVR